MAPVPPAQTLLSRSVLLLALGALALGCGQRDDAAPGAAANLIAEEPTLELDYEWAGPRLPVHEWDLLSPEDREPWTPVGGARWGEGVELVSQRARLRHLGPVDSERITGLLLTLDSARGCRLRIGWGTPDPTWADSGAPAKGGKTLQVDLTTHPQWLGSPDSLLLVLANCSGHRITGISFLGQSADPSGRLATNMPPAWKVTLGNDTRSAVLAPPGTVHSWTLTERLDGGFLRFSFGVHGRALSRLSFQVRSLVNGNERLLDSREFEADEWLSDPGWKDFSIPLETLDAGSEISIETQSPEPWSLEDSVPVIGAPRLVPRHVESSPNVLLISIDTLRADHLSLYGYARETTPNIDRRAHEAGIAFSNVVAPAGWTLPSHVSMFSGVNALRHGVNFATLPPTSVKLLAEIFSAAGRETVAFSAGGYVSSAFGLNRGFQSFRTRRDENPSVASSRQELADGVEQFESWLATEPHEPFFALFHTYEVHAPYWARSPFFESFGGERDELPRGYASTTQEKVDGGRAVRTFVIPGDKRVSAPVDLDLVTMAYDSGIAFMDSQIERLFVGLEQAGLLDDTIVVLTSDHGEALGEHGFAGHGTPHDEVVMVPLIVWLPQGGRGTMIEDQVQLVDVAPTLLDLAGLEIPAKLDGFSLRPLWEQTGGYTQRPAWIHAGDFGIGMRMANRVKYIWHRVPWDYFGPGEELYDLRTDPAESVDLVERDESLLASARTLTRQALDEQLPGFRLTFTNGTAAAYTLRVSSDGNRIAGVMGPGCRDLRWIPPRRVGFAVEPGTPCELTLEHLHASTVSIEVLEELAPDALTLSRLDFDTTEVEQPVTYALHGDSWQLDPPPLGDRLQVLCEWKRPPSSDEAADAKMDEALVEQLRALGYIE